MLRQPLAWTVRNVQIHMGQATGVHLVPDGTRHDVARREFCAVVVRGHEALAVEQTQEGTFAAQRLGD